MEVILMEVKVLCFSHIKLHSSSVDEFFCINSAQACHYMNVCVSILKEPDKALHI